MCGIAGVVSASREDLAAIASMTAALRHRGPDGEGYLLADSQAGWASAFAGPDTPAGIDHPPLPELPPERSNLAFGHRRLAIIDLGPGGHCPMASADGRLWVTYNGEIYNYLELRDELRAAGHRFTTASDTEVLLTAYAHWGPECLHRFNGMWAFAVYDARERLVFCARDRFGVKPFHYAWDGEVFAFASEIHGLLAHPRTRRRPHAPALHSFLAGGAIDEGEQTFFEDVLSLPAGHQLTLDLRSMRLARQRWYSLPAPAPCDGDPHEVARLVEDAVRLRLRSDVDVGTCLSGGLDSSSIVALTAALRGPEATGRHRSFSVVYPDAGLDESAHVGSIVSATGVLGSRVTPTSEELVRDLDDLVRHQGEPFPSAAPYSQWRVMRLAHEAGVKVLLDGQGADEVLAGYHYHYGPYLAETAARRGLVAALRAAGQASAVTGRPRSFFLGLFAFHALPIPRGLRAVAVARNATHGRVPGRLVDPAFARRAGAPESQRHAQRKDLASERRAAILATSLPALLRYEDRNSMAFSIEARTPYLDYRFVERAMALPAHDLIRDGWTKWILREAMTGRIPESVRLRRDKLGFATPQTRWLREIAPQVREWLGPGSRVAPMLRARALAAWLGSSDAALAERPGLWRLLSAELWLRSLERL